MLQPEHQVGAFLVNYFNSWRKNHGNHSKHGKRVKRDDRCRNDGLQKALNETNGDMDAAIEFLRKNGQAKAEKKAGRIAAEGIVKAVVKDDKVAAIVEVNSETDFVAKNEEFQGFVDAVVNQVADSDAADMDAFMAEAWAADTTKTVKDALVEKVAVIGENLNIRRFEKIVTDGCVVDYIHGGGRIGVLIEAEADVVNDEIKNV